MSRRRPDLLGDDGGAGPAPPDENTFDLVLEDPFDLAPRGDDSPLPLHRPPSPRLTEDGNDGSPAPVPAPRSVPSRIVPPSPSAAMDAGRMSVLPDFFVPSAGLPGDVPDPADLDGATSSPSTVPPPGFASPGPAGRSRFAGLLQPEPALESPDAGLLFRPDLTDGASAPATPGPATPAAGGLLAHPSTPLSQGALSLPLSPDGSVRRSVSPAPGAVDPGAPLPSPRRTPITPRRRGGAASDAAGAAGAAPSPRTRSASPLPPLVSLAAADAAGAPAAAAVAAAAAAASASVPPSGATSGAGGAAGAVPTAPSTAAASAPAAAAAAAAAAAEAEETTLEGALDRAGMTRGDVLFDVVSSFALYYGNVASLPPARAHALLSEFSLLVLDPTRVPDNLRSTAGASPLLLGRVVVARLYERHGTNLASDDIVEEVEAALQPGRLDGVLLSDIPDALLPQAGPAPGAAETLGARAADAGYGLPPPDFAAQLCSAIDAVLARREQVIDRGVSRRPLFFLEDAPALVESESLRKRLSGVLINNPTMRTDGSAKLRFGDEWERLQAQVSRLQQEMQQRGDFVVLCCETVVGETCVQPHLVSRFIDFCKQCGFVGWLSTDPSHRHLRAVQKLQECAPVIELLDNKVVTRFVRNVTEVPHALLPSSMEQLQLDGAVAVDGLFVAEDERDRHNPILYDETLLKHVEVLTRQFVSTRVIAPPATQALHAEWLACAAAAFKRLAQAPVPETEGKEADQAQMYAFIHRSVQSVLQTMASFEIWALENRYTDGHKGSSAVPAQALPPLPDPDLGECTAITYKPDVPLADRLTGQRMISVPYTRMELDSVVETVRSLRKKGVLKNMCAESMQEVFAYDTKHNDETRQPEAKFGAMVKQLQELCAAPPAHTRHILQAFGADPRAVFRLVGKLVSDLTTPFFPVGGVSVGDDEGPRRVQVWECDPAALAYTTDDNSNDRYYWAVSEFDGGHGPLHVYVSRYHPNMIEAVVHAYFQFHGYSHSQCVLLEGLVRSLRKPGTDEHRFQVMSDRIFAQIQSSSFRELAGFIQRTWKVKKELQVAKLPAEQKRLLFQLANEVQSAARSRLLDDVQAEQARTATSLKVIQGGESVSMPEPTREAQQAIARLALASVWQRPALAVLQRVLAVVGRGCEVLGSSGAAARLAHVCLQRTLRLASLDFLEIQIRDLSPYLVAASDVVTVYNEFNGRTNADCLRLFGVDKHTLGRVLYDRIRERSLAENPAPRLFEAKKTVYERDKNYLLSTSLYAKKYGNGLFFTFPLLVNFTLVLVLGLGIYNSVFMSDDHKFAVSLGMLLSFVFTGGINNIIARIGSLYNYRWSFSLVLTTVLRLFGGSFVLAVIFGILASFLAYAGTRSLSIAVILGPYFVGFSMMLITYAAVFTIHTKSIWRTREGLVILLSQFIPLVGLLVVFYGVGFATRPAIYQVWGGWLHLIAVWLAFLILFFSFIHIAHGRTVRFREVGPTADKDIIAWHAERTRQEAPPAMTGSAEQYENSLVEWLRRRQLLSASSPLVKMRTFRTLAKKEAEAFKRAARHAFAAAVNSALSTRRLGKLHPLVQKRVDNFDNEESLVHWYVLLTQKQRPEPASGEWDQLLVEALDQMNVKMKTDDPHRGGLQWDLVRSTVFHGISYFMLLFVDRIIRLFFSSTAGWFIPQSDYEVATGWALVFLLVATAPLEALLTRQEAAVRDSEAVRLGGKTATTYSLLHSRGSHRRDAYVHELLIFTVLQVVAAVIAGGLFTLLSSVSVFSPQGLTTDAVMVFMIALLGYTGLAMGSFNLLFMGGNLGPAAASMSGGVLVGLTVGCIVVGVTRNTNLTIIALSVAGWVYFASTMRQLRIAEKLSFPINPADMSPMYSTAMSTSGQRYAGQRSAPDEYARVLRQVRRLEDAEPVEAHSAVGLEVTELLETAANKLQRGGGGPLLQAAFPEGGTQLLLVLERWQSRMTIIKKVPEAALRSEDGFMYSAVAYTEPVLGRSQPRLVIYVGMDQEAADAQARRIAEALVHETFEVVWGETHAHAVVAELLLTVLRIPDAALQHIPSRIVNEIERAHEGRLQELDTGTSEAVLDSALMGIDMDRGWRTMPDGARRLVVAMLELLRTDFRDPAITTDEMCLRSGLGWKEYERAVRELHGRVLWGMRLARAQLLCRLAVAIKHAARKQLRRLRLQREAGSTEARIQAPVLPTDLGISHITKLNDTTAGLGFVARQIQKVDTVMRMWYLAFVADHSFCRELDYAWDATDSTEGAMPFAGKLAAPFMILLYNLCRWVNTALLWLPVRLYRPDINRVLDQLQRGLNRTTVYTRGEVQYVQRHNPDAPSTYFVQRVEGRIVATEQFPGILTAPPKAKPVARFEYGADGRLERTIRFDRTGGVASTATYQYAAPGLRVPTSKTVSEKKGSEMRDVARFEYDEDGRVVSGRIWCEGAPSEGVLARYVHDPTSPVVETRMTSAEYRNVPHDGKAEGTLTVHWNAFSAHIEVVEWRPYKDDDPFRSEFMYRHLKHVLIKTTKVSERADMARRRGGRYDNPKIFKTDMFRRVYSTPPTPFYDEDVLLEPPPAGGCAACCCCARCACVRWWRRRGTNVPEQLFVGYGWFGALWSFVACGLTCPLRSRYPVRRARSVVWRLWLKNQLEAVYARLWDESLLREEPLLNYYWRRRDWFRPKSAIQYVIQNRDRLTLALSLEAADVRTRLVITVADLAMLGAGGESRSLLVGEREALQEGRALQVCGLDSGTWPADGGGVASCRRDLVDRITSLRWHQISEVGNPMKVAMYNIEENVSSICIVPLWGSELGGPNETILSDIPYGKLTARTFRTNDAVIKDTFVPLLVRVLQGIYDEVQTMESIENATTDICNLYLYFQTYDWTMSWNHPTTHDAWRQACLFMQEKYLVSNRVMDVERPNVDEVDFALGLVMHFLMPLSVTYDPSITVVHASHHGIQTLLGVAAKKLYGASLVVWDHGILWRERLRALCELRMFSLFVRNLLVGFTRLAVRVNFANADMVVPCCSYGNPDWEVWLGGLYGHSSMSAIMRRKISPVLNGMETDRFVVKRELEEARPTAVMLSHVYDLKDIKNAIRAAGVIVHQFGLADFHLLVYGSLDKDVQYVSECRDLIAAEGLDSNVTLAGLGAAPSVLPKGWVFVNSSQSEGLPLALGEAGLAGLPVVCTDVGASREVVSEGDTVFGRVVPPRNAIALGRAILEVMCMLNELEELVTRPDEPKTQRLTLEDFKPLNPRGLDLAERMKAMCVKRQRLGMAYHAFIKRSFGIERYLREHEQTMWIVHQRSHERQRRVMESLIRLGLLSSESSIPEAMRTAVALRSRRIQRQLMERDKAGREQGVDWMEAELERQEAQTKLRSVQVAPLDVDD